MSKFTEHPRLVQRNLNAARIIELAKRPQGFSTSEITDMATSTLGRLMLDLCAEKLVFQAKANHRYCYYFGTAAEAAHWVLTQIRPVNAPVNRTPEQPPSRGVLSTRWAPDAMVTWPTHADGTPAFKMTIAPKLHAGHFRTSTFSN